MADYTPRTSILRNLSSVVFKQQKASEHLAAMGAGCPEDLKPVLLTGDVGRDAKSVRFAAEKGRPVRWLGGWPGSVGLYLTTNLLDPTKLLKLDGHTGKNGKPVSMWDVLRYRLGVTHERYGWISNIAGEGDSRSLKEQAAALDALEDATGLVFASVCMSGDVRPASIRAAGIKDQSRVRRGKSLHAQLALRITPVSPAALALREQASRLLCLALQSDPAVTDLGRVMRVPCVKGRAFDTDRKASPGPVRIQTGLRCMPVAYSLEQVVDVLHEHVCRTLGLPEPTGEAWTLYRHWANALGDVVASSGAALPLWHTDEFAAIAGRLYAWRTLLAHNRRLAKGVDTAHLAQATPRWNPETDWESLVPNEVRRHFRSSGWGGVAAGGGAEWGDARTHEVDNDLPVDDPRGRGATLGSIAKYLRRTGQTWASNVHCPSRVHYDEHGSAYVGFTATGRPVVRCACHEVHIGTHLDVAAPKVRVHQSSEGRKSETERRSDSSVKTLHCSQGHHCDPIKKDPGDAPISRSGALKVNDLSDLEVFSATRTRGDRWLTLPAPDVLDQMRVVYLRAPCGGGKTYAVRAATEGRSLIMVVPYRSLATAACKRFSAVHYESVTDWANPPRRLVICLDSVPKLWPALAGRVRWDDVVIDEMETVLDRIHCTLIGPRSGGVVNVLRTLLRECGRIWIADAHLTTRAVHDLRDMLNWKPHVDLWVANDRSADTPLKVMVHPKKEDIIALAEACIHEGGVPFIYVDARTEVKALHERLTEAFGPGGVAIHGDNSGEYRDKLEEVNRWLLQERPKWLVCTQTIQTGVSIEEDHFTHVFACATHPESTWQSVEQAIRRVRTPTTSEVHLHVRQNGFGAGQPKTAVQWARRYQRLEAGSMKLLADAEGDLRTDANGNRVWHPTNDLHFRMRCRADARRAEGSMARLDKLVGSLNHQGHGVTVVEDVDDDDLRIRRQEVRDAQKATKDAQKLRHVHEVHAECVRSLWTRDDADRLALSGTSDPDEARAFVGTLVYAGLESTVAERIASSGTTSSDESEGVIAAVMADAESARISDIEAVRLASDSDACYRHANEMLGAGALEMDLRALAQRTRLRAVAVLTLTFYALKDGDVPLDLVHRDSVHGRRRSLVKVSDVQALLGGHGDRLAEKDIDHRIEFPFLAVQVHRRLYSQMACMLLHQFEIDSDTTVLDVLKGWMADPASGDDEFEIPAAPQASTARRLRIEKETRENLGAILGFSLHRHVCRGVDKNGKDRPPAWRGIVTSILRKLGIDCEVRKSGKKRRYVVTKEAVLLAVDDARGCFDRLMRRQMDPASLPGGEVQFWRDGTTRTGDGTVVTLQRRKPVPSIPGPPNPAQRPEAPSGASTSPPVTRYFPASSASRQPAPVTHTVATSSPQPAAKSATMPVFDLSTWTPEEIVSWLAFIEK